MVIPLHTSVPWSQQGLAILIPKEDDHPPISRGYTNVYYTIPSRRNPIHDSGMTMPFFFKSFFDHGTYMKSLIIINYIYMIFLQMMVDFLVIFHLTSPTLILPLWHQGLELF